MMVDSTLEEFGGEVPQRSILGQEVDLEAFALQQALANIIIDRLPISSGHCSRPAPLSENG